MSSKQLEQRTKATWKQSTFSKLKLKASLQNALHWKRAQRNAKMIPSKKRKKWMHWGTIIISFSLLWGFDSDCTDARWQKRWTTWEIKSQPSFHNSHRRSDAMCYLLKLNTLTLQPRSLRPQCDPFLWQSPEPIARNDNNNCRLCKFNKQHIFTIENAAKPQPHFYDLDSGLLFHRFFWQTLQNSQFFPNTAEHRK